MKHRLTSPCGLAAALLIAGALAGAPALAAPGDVKRGNEHRPPTATINRVENRTDHYPPRVTQRPQRPAQPAPHPQFRPQRPPQSVAHRPPPPPPPRAHFNDRSRGIAHDYYARAYTGGRCPPGMSHRGPACAPDHARSWRRGYALPASVVYYDLPARLLVQLPTAPVGHRYVRVGGDILMLAIGSSIVIDALQDIFY